MWKYASSLFKALFENDVFLFENIILPYLADFFHEEGEKIRKHLDVKLHKPLFKNSICAY